MAMGGGNCGNPSSHGYVIGTTAPAAAGHHNGEALRRREGPVSGRCIEPHDPG
jgi:hypothetical protein